MISWIWTHRNRRLQPDDVLFEDGDLACRQGAKLIPLEQKPISITRVVEFPCSISSCKQTFDSLPRYESHYNLTHRHTCSVCKKIFPSNYLLDIHLLEWHDSMFQLMASKQDMYQCLVESCPLKFKCNKYRKSHMIDVHKFPSNYRFDRVKKNKNIKQTSNKSEEQMEVENTTDTTKNMDDTENTENVVDMKTNTMSQPKRIFTYRVPNTICFGQGSAKGFMTRRGRGARHWHQTHRPKKDTSVNIENVVMTDLTDALNTT